MRSSGLAMVLVLSLGVAACGTPKDDSAASDTTEAAAPAASESVAAATPADGKPAAFAQCAACHSVEKGKHGIGPSLAGVYGTKAGEIPGFAFSDPLKASGLTWDDATLDKWIENPAKLVPGTKMTFAGMADTAKRKELVDYVKSLK